MQSTTRAGALSVKIMSAAYSVAMFHRAAFGALAPSMQADTGLDAAALSMVASCFFWAYLLFQIPVGLLIDAAGPRKVSASGSFGMALGCFIFAFADPPWAFACARAITAMGAVAVFVSMVAQCRATYRHGVRGAIGSGMAIGNVGGMLAGIPLAILLESASWREASLGAAVIAVVIGLSTLYISPKDSPSSFIGALRRALPALGHALRKPHVYLGAGVMGGLAGSLHAFVGFGAFMLGSRMGFSTEMIGWLTTAMMSGFALGGAILGRMADVRNMRRPIGIDASLASAVLWLVLLFAAPASPLLLGAIFVALGFASGSYVNLYSTLDLFSEPESRASVTATANCGMAIVAGCSQLAQGLLPPAYAAAPSAAFAILGAVCCYVLINRANAIERDSTLSDEEETLQTRT